MSDDKSNKSMLPKNYVQYEDGVVVRQADMSLKKKLGAGKSLRAMLNETAVAKAEKSISDNAPEMLREIKAALAVLDKVVLDIKPGEVAGDTMRTIIEKGFEIKAKAGFCNYPLASAFARFMYLYSEAFIDSPISAKDANLISCCVSILSVIFARDFVGDGDNESLDQFWDSDPETRSPFDV